MNCRSDLIKGNDAKIKNVMDVGKVGMDSG